MEAKNVQPDLEVFEKLLSNQKQMLVKGMVKRQATPEHNPSKLKGIGYTRKNKDQPKNKQKNAKMQRAINRKMANKKFRPSGSKKKEIIEMIHKLFGVILLGFGIVLLLGGNSAGMIITSTGQYIIFGCLLGGLGLIIL